MPDRRRRTRLPQTNSLVAAAQVMVSPNQNVARASMTTREGWQNEAWAYYDTIGELRFGVNWIANAMSRVNLAAAAPPTNPGDEPWIIDPASDEATPAQKRAAEIVSIIADGAAGQGQILNSFGIHLSVAGIAYLVAEPAAEDLASDEFTSWSVVAAEEIRTHEGHLQIRIGEREWRPAHPNAVVVKIWRKHPRHSWKPDAPTRGVLTVLREIDLLTKHIQASAQSRLAGAGLLAIPSEAVFPPGQGPQSPQNPYDPENEDTTPPEDNFVDTLIDAMTVPLTDRGSAAAVVPLVVKVPGELVDKLKHISFSTPFDDRVESLLDNAIKRLALGLDIPPEILTGTSAMNHWGAWQVAEEAITLHIEPLCETVVHALTIGFLRPALIAEGFDPDEAMVWYDTSDLRTRPDRSKAAVEAYDRYELSSAAMLREMGLSTDDMPDDDEKRQRVLLAVLNSVPALAPALLEELGFIDAGAVAPAPEIPNENAIVEEVAQVEGPPRGIPDEPDTPDETPGPDAIVAAALAAACDVMVRRALERAGARLRSAAGKGQPGGAASIDCPDPMTFHTRIDATAYADLGSLLEGAWTLVPEIADRYEIDAVALTETLDSYTRALLAARQEHRYGRLAVALGSN